jgi:XRE family aerobic/anaerobic benzoate catabolism transcriptional regulator
MSTLTESLGSRVRARRTELSWSQRQLAERSGLSQRFLVQLERGDANPSITRLADLAGALDCTLTDLLQGLGPQPLRKVALVGLRGAGKSTVGRALAAHRGWGFVELDVQVEARAGMTLAEIFEFHGAEHYRSLARQALREVLEAPEPVVIEVGGSLVLDPEAYGLLRKGCRVVWLRARPETHLVRVREQGDLRPMTGRSNPLGELREILAAREPLYGLADDVVDTEGLSVDQVVARTA